MMQCDKIIKLTLVLITESLKNQGMQIMKIFKISNNAANVMEYKKQKNKD